MGVCAVINDKEYGIIAVRGNYGTDVDVYGLGTHFIGANCKRSYDIDVHDDNIVMCHNNITMTSDLYLIEKYANILNEIDKSLNTNIVYSRVYPLPRVGSQKEEKQISAVLKSIFKGEIGKLISKENDINDLLANNNIDIVNLTDGNQSVHMDTLVRLKDTVLKNFLREIGINVNTLDKSAQVTTHEIQAFISYSNLNLYDYFNERKKFVEEINTKFGTDIQVAINEMLISQILNDTEPKDNIPAEEPESEEPKAEEMKEGEKDVN